jgi:hypothetical protein
MAGAAQIGYRREDPLTWERETRRSLEAAQERRQPRTDRGLSNERSGADVVTGRCVL